MNKYHFSVNIYIFPINIYHFLVNRYTTVFSKHLCNCDKHTGARGCVRFTRGRGCVRLWERGGRMTYFRGGQQNVKMVPTLGCAPIEVNGWEGKGWEGSNPLLTCSRVFFRGWMDGNGWEWRLNPLFIFSNLVTSQIGVYMSYPPS